MRDFRKKLAWSIFTILLCLGASMSSNAQTIASLSVSGATGVIKVSADASFAVDEDDNSGGEFRLWVTNPEGLVVLLGSEITIGKSSHLETTYATYQWVNGTNLTFTANARSSVDQTTDETSSSISTQNHPIASISPLSWSGLQEISASYSFPSGAGYGFIRILFDVGNNVQFPSIPLTNESGTGGTVTTIFPSTLLNDGDYNAKILVDFGVIQEKFPVVITINNNTPVNIPPIADAGDDQTLKKGLWVSLEGTQSSDPDGDYPLEYFWKFLTKPENSNTILDDPQTANPKFFADVSGDYVLTLRVTDAKGASSDPPDQVIISTFNTPPIAAAGPDQSITEIGSIVELNGSQSYDDDGDPLNYSWTIISKPDGSYAELSNSSSIYPVFEADKNGEYLIDLVVSDPWASSGVDQVIVSFDNLAPVADAGSSQSIILGETAYLDGTNSFDANLDPINYYWEIVSKPSGSLTEINNPESPYASLIPDISGSYTVSLTVDDGFWISDPNNLSIFVSTYPDQITYLLDDAQTNINDLKPESLKNKNNIKSLTNKINAVLDMVENGEYEEAFDKLNNDILNKTNGCADMGVPDVNDWIQDCDAQEKAYPFIMEALYYLQYLQ